MIEAVEIRTVRLPLRAPFQTSNGASAERELVLVRTAGEVAPALRGVVGHPMAKAAPTRGTGGYLAAKRIHDLAQAHYATDLTAPVTLEADGHVLVPSEPGIGATPDPDLLRTFTVDTWSYER